MKSATSIAVLLVMLIVGAVQLRLGYVGIERHLGTLAAVLAALAFFVGVFLPITVGSYFGAVDVMKWPVWVGLLIATPGLLFITPIVVFRVLRTAYSPLMRVRAVFASVSTTPPNDMRGRIAEPAPDIEGRSQSSNRTEATVRNRFLELARYSRHLRDLSSSLDNLPSNYQSEWQHRVVDSKDPLRDAEVIRDELLRRYALELEPFDSDESNFYYSECKKLFGMKTAQNFATMVRKLGASADPHEIFETIVADECLALEKSQQAQADSARAMEVARKELYIVLAVVAVILASVVAVSLFDLNRQPTEQITAMTSGGKISAVGLNPMEPAAEPIADDLSAAFFAATGNAEAYIVSGSGISASQPAVQTTKPERLIQLPHSLVLLTSTSIEGACHACTGYLGVYYMRRVGTSYEVAGRWPEAIQGSAWGKPPKNWIVTDKFTTWPAIYAESEFLAQGELDTWAVLTELAPAGPVASDQIDISHNSESASTKGIITNIQKSESFEVVYSGSCSHREKYTYQASRFVLTSPGLGSHCK